MKDEKLVESVEENMEKLWPDGEVASKVVDVADADDADEADDAKETAKTTPEETPADKAVDKVETTPDPETTVEENNKAGEVKGLSDSLYRAAVHQGWTPEEIKKFYDGQPDQAEKTFKRIYDSTNKLTAEFARLGRAKPEVKVEDKPAAVVTDDAKMAALKEQYGADDPLVLALESLQAKVESNARVTEAPAVATVDVALQKTVQSFFADGNMKPFNEFYGTATETQKLTGEQFKNRMSVLELADNILTGSKKLGREMEIPEALDFAHLMVSEPMREKALRSELLAKVVKRGKGLTLEPKSIAEPEAKSGPITKEALEAKTAERLNKLYS